MKFSKLCKNLVEIVHTLAGAEDHVLKIFCNENQSSSDKFNAYLKTVCFWM